MCPIRPAGEGHAYAHSWQQPVASNMAEGCEMTSRLPQNPGSGGWLLANSVALLQHGDDPAGQVWPLHAEGLITAAAEGEATVFMPRAPGPETEVVTNPLWAALYWNHQAARGWRGTCVLCTRTEPMRAPPNHSSNKTTSTPSRHAYAQPLTPPPTHPPNHQPTHPPKHRSSPGHGANE